MDWTFSYLASYLSMTETSYPYTATDTTCAYNSASGVISTKGYTTVTPRNTAALATEIYTNPVTVAI
jgi:hypothetical protein